MLLTHLLSRPESTVFKCIGSFVLALATIQRSQILQSSGYSGGVNLGSLVPTTIFTVGNILLVTMLVLLTFLCHLPDWFVVSCRCYWKATGKNG
jgi:hypothetical protein